MSPLNKLLMGEVECWKVYQKSVLEGTAIFGQSDMSIMAVDPNR